MTADPGAKAVRDALAEMLGTRAAVAVWGVDTTELHLFPGESISVERAVASRRREFAQGRACARAALAALGEPPGEIAVGSHREPRWPPGFVGAITHAGGVVAAAAGRSADFSGLGIDIEVAGSLEGDGIDEVLTPGERAALEERAAHGADATAWFSAKEAVHKAIFPSTRVWLDFRDVEVVAAADGGFVARCARGIPPGPAELREMAGELRKVRGFVVSVVKLPVSQPR